MNVELYLGMADLVDRSSLDTARGEAMPPTPIMSPMSTLLAIKVLSSARPLVRLELFPTFLELESCQEIIKTVKCQKVLIARNLTEKVKASRPPKVSSKC